MKRKRGTLTGGTGDVNPQFLSSAIPLNGATAETSIQLPVTRIPQSGVATIIEIIKIWWDWKDTSTTAAAGVRTELAVVTFGTKSFGATKNAGMGEPTVFAVFSLANSNAFTAAGTYDAVWNPIQMMDFDDGAGHGILVATDKMYVQTTMGTNTATTDNTGWSFKMLYRFKNVGIEEYVGIVQSQQ